MMWNWHIYPTTVLNEKALRETQTLRSGCSKAEPKLFAPPQTPFPRARDGQNLISWRWSLPLPTYPVCWGSMHAVSSYRAYTQTHTHTHTETGPITIHCAAASAQCNERMWHFRGSKHTLTPFTYFQFSGGQDPAPPHDLSSSRMYNIFACSALFVRRRFALVTPSTRRVRVCVTWRRTSGWLSACLSHPLPYWSSS